MTTANRYRHHGFLSSTFHEQGFSTTPAPRPRLLVHRLLVGPGGFFFPSVVFLPTSVTSPPAHAHTVGCRAAATDERAAEPSPAPPADASSSPQLPPPHLAPLSNALGGNYTLPPPPPPEDARIEAEGYSTAGARACVFLSFSHMYDNLYVLCKRVCRCVCRCVCVGVCVCELYVVIK